MALQRVLRRYRLVVDIPDTFRHWLESLHPVAPAADWNTDLRLSLVDATADALDIEESLRQLRSAAQSLPPLHIRATGVDREDEGGQYTVVLPLASRSPLSGVRRTLAGAFTGAADAQVRVLPAGEPRLVAAGDLTPASSNLVCLVIARSLGSVDFCADRLSLWGAGGHSGEWYEIGTIRLGETRPPTDLIRPPLLRHARGWRLAG